MQRGRELSSRDRRQVLLKWAVSLVDGGVSIGMRAVYDAGTVEGCDRGSATSWSDAPSWGSDFTQKVFLSV